MVHSVAADLAHAAHGLMCETLSGHRSRPSDGVQVAGAQHAPPPEQVEGAVGVGGVRHGHSMFRYFVDCNKLTKIRNARSQTPCPFTVAPIARGRAPRSMGSTLRAMKSLSVRS